MSKLSFSLKVLAFTLLLIIAGTLVTDLIRISGHKTLPRRPEKPIHLQQDLLYHELADGQSINDWSRLDGTLKYIDNQYDCSDFRFVNLVRILYEYGDSIPPATMSKIEQTLFGFRYWWDEPGENSMCYWSENHQILFASAEYLVGQKYPDVIYDASGLSGQDHMNKARTRILDWLEMRWNYGFTEFFSNVYYKEDIGAMINLIDFADDEEIALKTEIIMDLLLLDVATQSVGNMFISASGRAYEGNRKGGPDADFGGLTSYFWGDGTEIRSGIMYGMMTTGRYELPPVLTNIAHDTNTVIIKQSHGLDIKDLEVEGYFGTDNRSMMMQWGMEAFTNEEIVRNSLAHMRQTSMFSNEFIADFKMLDFTLLRWLRLEPWIVRLINPQTNGVAIQQGNTYTYKTGDYSVYTAQQYHPGTYGDQQHLTGMNVSNAFSIFHTHPALDKNKKYQSPNYWVGYGHIPHVAQDRNVSLAIYNIPEKKGLMEMALLDFTHAYFPLALFDTAFVDKNYALGKKGQTYCAFIGQNPLLVSKESNDDIVQEGKQTFWILEAGSQLQDGSFRDFCQRIRTNKYNFDPRKLQLTYESNDNTFELAFGAGFRLNGQPVNTEYERFESPYCRAKQKPQTITIAFQGDSLFLDFYGMIRRY